jgi:Mg2+-importing ATPase
VAGAASSEVLELAAVNAALETGLASPLDDAILKAREPRLAGVEKLAEIPFDFVRKRVSVIVRGPEGVRLVSKGAFAQVLSACTRTAAGVPLDAAATRTLEERCAAWNGAGVRVLAVAVRELRAQDVYGRSDERELVLMGFLTFLDRPKDGSRDAIEDLARLGVSV